MSDPSAGPAPAPVLVLLGGASGSGKSYLGRTYGRPHLQLDAFYREAAVENLVPDGGEPVLFPRTPYGRIDWDHPATWSLQAALDAVVELLETGRTRVPRYSIATSSITGHEVLELAGGPVIAEGIFADELPAALDRAQVAYRAWYIDQHPLPTAARRLTRDLAERRKPVTFLLRRGWAHLRSNRALRERYLCAGFIPVPKPWLKGMLADAVGR